MIKQYRISLLLIGATLFFYACAYNKGEITPKGCSTVIDTVSFAIEIQPILTAKCANVGCHSGNNPEGNLNLEASKAYAALSKQGKGYIDVNDPKSSVLYSSLISTSVPMPPLGQQPLSSCDLKRIETWMKEGALDN